MECTHQYLLSPCLKPSKNLFTHTYLPPAYEVRGKVLFSQVSVCPHFWGGDPIQPVARGGVPHPRSRHGGLPLPRSGEWGYPIQLMGVGERELPHPRSRQGGRGSPPIQDWMGYPPPSRRRSSVASTCYAAGGVPHAVTQDFLVNNINIEVRILRNPMNINGSPSPEIHLHTKSLSGP